MPSALPMTNVTPHTQKLSFLVLLTSPLLGKISVTQAILPTTILRSMLTAQSSLRLSFVTFMHHA